MSLASFLVRWLGEGGPGSAQLHLPLTTSRLHCYIKFWQALCWQWIILNRVERTYLTFPWPRLAVSRPFWPCWANKDFNTDGQWCEASTTTSSSLHSLSVTDHRYIMCGDGTKFFLYVNLIAWNVRCLPTHQPKCHLSQSHKDLCKIAGEKFKWNSCCKNLTHLAETRQEQDWCWWYISTVSSHHSIATTLRKHNRHTRYRSQKRSFWLFSSNFSCYKMHEKLLFDLYHLVFMSVYLHYV